ncbi:MAG: pyridoxamine 5'-phosphate oxidase family protein [Clostridia bacterium]|nr:pyridoxamine 5'-phosphate oxidase family protein [Clostridia bacterium]
MRKSQREIKDKDAIEDILKRAQIMHLGLASSDDMMQPYIVPLSYGYERGGSGFIFYFHCAREGRKMDLWRAGQKIVTVEIDILNGYKGTGHSVTADYESFMGTGILAEAETREEKIHGLQLILDHCGVTGYSAENCEAAGRVCVMEVFVNDGDYTAKKRFPEQNDG